MEKPKTRRIRIFEHVSLDGVIEHEDGYEYGAWTTPFRSPAGLAAVIETQGTGFDLLLGRRTYDLWANYWPKAGDTPIANVLNSATKYVATHRPDTLGWGPVKALGSDIIAAMRGLKSETGPDLILWGSSTLTSPLLEQGLVDEVVLLVYPVLLGRGKRVLSEHVAARELGFVSTKATATGVLVNVYRYVGPLRHT